MLNYLRNLCAHHSRVWDRVLAIKPKFPRKGKYPAWNFPDQTKRRVFGALTISMFLLKHTAPQSRWNERFFNLLDEYPEIPLENMGFIKDWQKKPIWINLGKHNQ